jgi:cell division protein FtsL
MAAWADNTARAHAPAAPQARPRPRPAAKPATRARTRQRVAPVGGVLWIALLAALLGGIVALNVLQANVRLDELAKERAELQGANAALSSQLSTAGATPQVEALARQRLGLEPATPEQTTYVELKPRR